MEYIPQPARNPYEPGDKVSIYLDPKDTDYEYDGCVCEVIEVFKDELGTETKRELDSYSYRLRNTDSQEVLPITFRHSDLIPSSDC